MTHYWHWHWHCSARKEKASGACYAHVCHRSRTHVPRVGPFGVFFAIAIAIPMAMAMAMPRPHGADAGFVDLDDDDAAPLDGTDWTDWLDRRIVATAGVSTRD